MASDFKYISLRQLRLVARLGTALSLSGAAHDLHMTQPAASRSLAQIELLLGVKLFDRTRKTLMPTAAGMRLILHAQRMLDALDAAEHEMSGAKVFDELRIGAISSISSTVFSEAIRVAKEKFPDVQIKVLTGNIGHLYGQLLTGAIDLMISHAELSVDLNRIIVSPIYEEFTSIVARPGHKLVRRKSLTWEDIANQPWVLPPSFTPSRPKLDRLLALHRTISSSISPDVEIESSAIALQLLSTGDYVWSLASREARMWENAGLVRPLAQPETVLRGHMCSLQIRGSDSKDSVREFLKIFTAQASAPLP